MLVSQVLIYSVNLYGASKYKKSAILISKQKFYSLCRDNTIYPVWTYSEVLQILL